MSENVSMKTDSRGFPIVNSCWAWKHICEILALGRLRQEASAQGQPDLQSKTLSKKIKSVL